MLHLIDLILHSLYLILEVFHHWLTNWAGTTRLAPIAPSIVPTLTSISTTFAPIFAFAYISHCVTHAASLSLFKTEEVWVQMVVSESFLINFGNLTDETIEIALIDDLIIL